MRIIKAKHAILLIMAVCLPLTTGCFARLHTKDVDPTKYDKRLTLGTVQKEIKEGMSSAVVAEALGAPNIVSTDSEGLEVWIYDRISTSTAFSESGVGLKGVASHGSDNFWKAGTFFTGRSRLSTGAATKNQKVLTVIVKFDTQNKVRGVSYHASSF